VVMKYMRPIYIDEQALTETVRGHSYEESDDRDGPMRRVENPRAPYARPALNSGRSKQ